MKTLFLMRHASAANGADDHDRALTPTGVREAERIAELLGNHETPPTLLLCSSARRTLETLAPLEKRLPAHTQARTLPELYLASADAMLRCVAEAEDDHQTLLVLAHFPGVAEFAKLLTSRGDEEARDRLGRSFPPASVATLRLAVESWAEARGKLGELLQFTRPADLD